MIYNRGNDLATSIHHYGTFDVDNYGDLLFPLILSWRLGAALVENISPTEQQSTFKGAAPSSDAPRLFPKATVLGGGNIFTFRRTPLALYGRNPYEAYPALSLNPASVSAKYGVPFIVNAPSIAVSRFNFLERMIARRILSQAHYIAFRDQESVQIAHSLGATKAQWVPDTVLDISRMWPELKKDDVAESDYFAIHVNQRYGGAPEEAAAAIDQIARLTGKRVILLPIGPCHGDLEYTRTVADMVSCNATVERELDLKNFAAIIANACFYLGSSMHGFITAASYSVPCGLVLSSNIKRKFNGVLKALHLRDDIVFADWPSAAERIGALKRPSSNALAEVFSNLDNHWENVQMAFITAASKTSFPKRLLRICATASGRLYVLLGQVRSAVRHLTS